LNADDPAATDLLHVGRPRRRRPHRRTRVELTVGGERESCAGVGADASDEIGCALRKGQYVRRAGGIQDLNTDGREIEAMRGRRLTVSPVPALGVRVML